MIILALKSLLTDKNVSFGTYCCCSPSNTSITGCFPFFIIISDFSSIMTGLKNKYVYRLNVE